MTDQADFDRWAGLVAAAYAAAAYAAAGPIPISPTDVLDLAGELGEPLAHCLMLAIPPSDWGPDYVNPVLDRWEARMRRRRGRRLGAVNFALGSLVME